ncbi:MAG: hypothetical protein ACSHX7_00815 [Luteolibacter sp.]
MTRLILAAIAVATAVFTTSCGCCTSDALAPPLRPLPQFKQIEPTVEYTK